MCLTFWWILACELTFIRSALASVFHHLQETRYEALSNTKRQEVWMGCVALMSPRLLANLFPAGLKSSCGQGNACPAAQILRLARRLGESSWQVTLRNLPLIVQFRSGNSVSWDSWTLIVCHKIAENCCEMSFLTRLFFWQCFAIEIINGLWPMFQNFICHFSIFCS